MPRYEHGAGNQAAALSGGSIVLAGMSRDHQHDSSKAQESSGDH